MKIADLNEAIENDRIITEMFASACPHCGMLLYSVTNEIRTNHINTCPMRKHTQQCIIKQGESGNHYKRKARFLESCCWCHK